MKRTFSHSFPLLGLLGLALASAACDPPAPTVSTTGTTTAPKPPLPPPLRSPSPAPAPLQASGLPAPLAKPATTEEWKALAKSDNAFSLDFYGRARTQKGNLILSPFSVSTALAMTLAGAKGDTAAQMAKVLHFEGNLDRTLDLTGSLVATYGAPDSKVTVRIANRLFGEKTYAFEKPYLTRVQSAFGAPLEPLDFKGAGEDSRGRINAWVAKETNDRIKDLVPPGGVDKDTRLALVNAIYFLGNWATPFTKERSGLAPFFTGKTDKKDVTTMHQEDHFRFAAASGVKVLELPYENGALAMDFVLPDAVDGLDAVEARLTPAVFDGWMSAAQSDKVIVSLPKFEVAPAAALSVGDTLSAMGMPLAFDRRSADFTGIANPPNLDERLYLGKVFHKGFIRVDEKGTEAAAASAATMAVAGVEAPGAPPKEFKADHPFLFFLRDTRSGLVLFMGRVADPAAK